MTTSLGLLLDPANRIIDRIIRLDPDAATRIAPLTGRRIRVVLSEPEITVDATFTTDGLHLAEPGEDVADVTVSGRLGDLLALARDPEAGGSGLRFEGDAAVAQQVRRFFRELDVDWEEGLATYLGDAPAHQIGRLVRGVRGWFAESTDAAGRNLAEYLTEERRDLPPRAEVEAFLDDVDRLRSDTDRLAARISLLEQRTGSDGA